MFRSLKKRVKAAVAGQQDQQYGSGIGSDSNNNNSSEIRPSSFHSNTRAKSMDTAATTSSSTTTRMPASVGELFLSSNTNNAISKHSNNNNNKQRRRGGKRSQQQQQERVLSVSELTSKVSQLASFDACVDAADALAAASHHNQQHHGQVLSRRVDAKSGLPDCSVLVSPDGNLLLLPLPPTSDDDEDEAEEEHHTDDCDDDQLFQQSGHDNKKKKNVSSSSSSSHLFSDLIQHAQENNDDYDSAIYLGNDLCLHTNGDKACNGFSARGWSVSATSFALRQTQASMQQLQAFTEGCILTRKECAARTGSYCDEFAQSMPAVVFPQAAAAAAAAALPPFCEWQDLEGIINTMPTNVTNTGTGGITGTTGGGGRRLPNISSSNVFGPTPRRTGPYTAPQASLGKALCALEQYHQAVAHDEGNRWRQASAQRKAVLPMLHLATEQFNERSSRRLQALEESSKRARYMEERFALLRMEAHVKWQHVYEAEDEATRRHEALLQERSRLREQQRLDHLEAMEQEVMAAAAAAAAAAATSGGGGENATLGATTEEIWDMVSAISESMQDGSFEPIMDLPSPKLSTSWDNKAVAVATTATADINNNNIITTTTSSNQNLNVNAQNQQDEATTTTTTTGAEGFGSSSPTTTQATLSLSDGTTIGATATTAAANITPSIAGVSSDDSSVLSAAASVVVAIPVISREQVEEELNLPTLRALAMAADDVVDDAAGSLLNVLSNLDTTRRSARIAAETALVSAGNAQAACIKSLVKLERASLEARLAHLQELENATKHIEVRADLDAYISLDKKERGGTSHLGDDDDGGIASALAVLSSHVDGANNGTGTGSSSLPPSRKGSEDVEYVDNFDDDNKKSTTTREMLHAALDKLFTKRKTHTAGQAEVNMTSPERQQYGSSLQASVDFLCKTAGDDTSPAARTRRSTICYALNSKRSNHVEIASVPQFDGLCNLFAALLTSCASDEGGMSNAKMLMMLAQTFYITSSNRHGGDDKNVDDNDEDEGLMDDVDLSERRSPVRNSRSQRVYIRNRLMDHPIWSKDDFWDEVLSQQISESLTQSGVMSNFEGSGGGGRRRGSNSGSYRQERKSKWYDLSYEERVSAASQVHAVVFAQLGALAHSMIEFGCGLERSCAFVRRMSIRNQLPTAQRTMLLQHLIDRDDIDRRESSSAATSTIAVTTKPAPSPPPSVNPATGATTTIAKSPPSSPSRTEMEDTTNS